jgi:F0F1-type ATP synthase gamma subunit
VGSNVRISALLPPPVRSWWTVFWGDEYDEVYIIYSEFVSMAKQLPVVQKLLPIPPIEKEETEESGSRTIPGRTHL